VASSRRSGTRRAEPTRYGSTEPRVWTKPLRKLTPRTSLGFSVIDFAEQVLEVELFPWQKWLLIHALELLPDGSFRFRTVVLLVGRQNGKSTLGQVLALYFLYVREVRLVLGTAQNLDVSSDLWRDTVEMAQEVPELAAEIDNIVRQLGRETMLLYSGSRYQVAAASRRGGRGKSGDLVLMDELREHQNWQAWSALTKTTMARRMALVWCMSNAGDITSLVLRHLRKQAHKSLGDPDRICADPFGELPDVVLDDDPELAELLVEQGTSVGFFEWSAPPGCSIYDRDGWAQANPSMNYGDLSERNIAAAAATDAEWEFRTEVLCQWFEGQLEGPFEQGKWERGSVTEAPEAGTAFELGLDVSADRSRTHIVSAYVGPEGVPQLALEASRYGTDWPVEWITERATAERPLRVGVQKRGAPASPLIEELAKIEHVTVYEWEGPDLAAATALVHDLVNASALGDDGVRKGLTHLPAPALDVAAATATVRKLTDGGIVWDRVRSPNDAAPIVAGTIALWMLQHPPEPPKRSAYDDGARLTVLD
jgi:phage terminase large subunit-like protein